MNYRRLGKSGLKVSELSFGAWVSFAQQVNDDIAYSCMSAAHDAGVNFFDNAEAYASGEAESQMGRVLKKAGWRRESLVLSTKIYWGGAGPNDVGLSHKHVIEGANACLKRLQVDYVDVLFCHRADPDTPIEETVRAMDILVKQGKIFYWGTSEWSAAEIMRADAIARENGLTPPSVEQPQYNMFWRERFEKEYLPLYKELGYGTTIWSPLASGLLTGKYNEGVPADSRLAMENYKWLQGRVLLPERIEKVKKLGVIATEMGVPMAQLALAWCLKNRDVSTVITGASRPDQVRENLQALAVVPKLTTELMARIEVILGNQPNLDRP